MLGTRWYEVCLTGVDTDAKRVWIDNSWGVRG